MAPPRDATQREQDVLDRFTRDVDAWVASADQDGNPYLVPLSFLWDGTELIVATSIDSPTGRNLRAAGRVRLAFGLTRDVVLVDGAVTAVQPTADVPDELGDEFAAKSGFDPRTSGGSFRYFRIRPERVQAWREENELKGRELMREGRWLTR